MSKLIFLRLFAFILILSNSVLSIYNTILITKSDKNIPVVYNVNEETGLLKMSYEDYHYSIPEETIVYYINDFIEKIRTVDKDKNNIKNNWLQAYRMADNAAIEKQINEYYFTWQPFEMLQKYLIYISFVNNTKQSDGSYEVIWKEIRLDSMEGYLVDERYYKAIVDVKIKQPTYEEDIIKNTIGLYIEKFSLAKINM